jgi:hypothetical protein
MTENTLGEHLRFQKGTVAGLVAGWPLVASAAFLVVGVALGTRTGTATTSPQAVTVLILLATLAGGAGAVALLRTSTAPVIRPYVGLVAAVAAILALTPVATLSTDLPLPFFLLIAPWRYALIPLAVHFAFAIGWPHRKRNWAGLVIGWYAIHAAMLAAAVIGIVAGEAPLLAIVDTTFRARILEPAGVATAVAALAVAIASPSRRSAQRRATGWAFAALLLGLAPTVLALVIPSAATSIDGSMTTARLALALVAYFGFAAVLALPFVNPLNRDLLAHRFATRLLDTEDIAEVMRDMAQTMAATFETEGVTIRLMVPELLITEGKPRPIIDTTIAPEPETIDDHRTLVAPIGRVADPLGELRLDARHAGAFGERERIWLAAFLLPVAAALRARSREVRLRGELAIASRSVLEASAELMASASQLPVDGSGGELAVPPPVDASEVLGQLSDGLEGVSRRAHDLEGEAAEAHSLVREAIDQVAQALDALRGFTSDLVRLGTWGDEIGASNQTVSGVAFRTNLLANNAALEATRAGSAGKTFGVLAEEIRRLADATAGSSTAIEGATASFAADLATLGERLEEVRLSLVAAIRKSEVGEDSARRLTDTAGAVLGYSRSLRPAVDEAHAVAQRRSARDVKLTDTLERFVAERGTTANQLHEHRLTLERITQALERLGRQGTRRP